MKVEGKMLTVNITHDICVGELKATLQAHVIMNDDGSSEIDFSDICDITYMGMSINGYAAWKKFKAFHMEMGIDFGKIVTDEFDRVFTAEAVTKLLEDEKIR